MPDEKPKKTTKKKKDDEAVAEEKPKKPARAKKAEPTEEAVGAPEAPVTPAAEVEEPPTEEAQPEPEAAAPAEDEAPPVEEAAAEAPPPEEPEPAAEEPEPALRREDRRGELLALDVRRVDRAERPARRFVGLVLDEQVHLAARVRLGQAVLESRDVVGNLTHVRDVALLGRVHLEAQEVLESGHSSFDLTGHDGFMP